MPECRLGEKAIDPCFATSCARARNLAGPQRPSRRRRRGAARRRWRKPWQYVLSGLATLEPDTSCIGVGPARHLDSKPGVPNGHDADRARRFYRCWSRLIVTKPRAMRSMTDHDLAAHIAKRVRSAITAIGKRRVNSRWHFKRRVGHQLSQETQRPTSYGLMGPRDAKLVH